jgi:glyoxylase-like metal-dependent hydrolase (beta-lactamase superfamily II)
MIVVRGSNVIHTGDVFRTGAYPIIDQGNGGTLEGTFGALGMIIAAAGPDTIILPGLGELTDRAAVIAFRDMVEDIVNTVRPLVASGCSTSRP